MFRTYSCIRLQLLLLETKFTDLNGNPLSGGKVYSYIAGTSTQTPTYTNATMSTQNSNPILLDSTGFASIWLDPSLAYKFVITDFNNVTQRTLDDITTSAAQGPAGAQGNQTNQKQH